MGTVTMRYWAAAKDAAGVAEQRVTADTLAEALASAVAAAAGTGDSAVLQTVLARCSFLVDGNPVGRRSPESVQLSAENVVEVLPPFAGG
jgi:molybdopterin converting factor small subunit